MVSNVAEDIEKVVILEKDVEKKIAYITFNRPEKLNAFLGPHWERIAHLISSLEDDEDVKVVVIKGNGRCFGTGHDVADLGYLTGFGGPGEPLPYVRRNLTRDRNSFWGRRGVMQTVLHSLKPTIAQVHGYCYGGHWELAMACDLVIASEDSLFTHPAFGYLGPTTDFGLFIEVMGLRKMKEMVLTGRPLGALEAERFGLITKVVPADKLEEEVNAYAGQIATLPLDGLVLGKMHMEAVLDARGIGTAYDIGTIIHTLQLRQRYGPGEFHLLKARRDSGVKGAFREGEERRARQFRLRK